MKTLPWIVLALCAAGCAKPPAAAIEPPFSVLSEHEKRLAEVNATVERLKPGTSRAVVERIFTTKDGGLQGPSLTRYYMEPEVMIDVPYDKTGGNWSGENRVNGPVRVYRSMMHLD